MCRPLLVRLAAIGGLLASASPALATIKDIQAASPSATICVSTDSLTTALSFELLDPRNGQIIASTSLSAPSAATACAGSTSGGTSSWVPAFVDIGSGQLAGTLLRVQDGTTTVDLPLGAGAYSTGDFGSSGAGTGNIKLRNLPPNATVATASFGPIATAGGTYDSSAPVATPGLTVTATGVVTSSASDPVTYQDGIDMRAYAAVAHVAAGANPEDLRTGIEASGINPLGGPATATLIAADGATVLDSQVLLPRPGASTDASGAFGVIAPPGAYVSLQQPGWFDATVVQFPSAAMTADGFTVSIPAGPATCTALCNEGFYDYQLTFVDPSSIATRSTGDVLRCSALGLDVSAFGDCSSITGPHFSATASGVAIVPGDYVQVTSTQANDSEAVYSSFAGGVLGSMDDGLLSLREQPRSALSAMLTDPRPAPLPPVTLTRTATTDARGGYSFGQEAPAPRYLIAGGYLPAHIANGATVTFSGPAIGASPHRYTYDLTASLAGSTLSGTTYPGAAVLVVDKRGVQGPSSFANGTYQFTNATSGAWSVTLPDPQPGDEITITAVDPASHDATDDSIRVGDLQPTIVGIGDQQLVRGTVMPTVAGAGVQRVIWGGDVPEFATAAPPYAYPLDTTKLRDGPYRIEATASPQPSATAYIYAIVDNTPPTGGAGADQTVARHRNTTFVTAAGDANGLSAVTIVFGDGRKLSQPAASLGAPMQHVYARLGTFRATATITDAAGNVRTDTAVIRVVKTLSAEVTGTIPTRIKRHANLHAKLTARLTGQLELQLLTHRNKAVVDTTYQFARAHHATRITLRTGKVARGSYTLVAQFIDANGVAGPVVTRTLRIT